MNLLDENGTISAMLQSIVRNTNDLMFIKNKDFVYVAASTAFAVDCVGYSSADDVIGKTDFELFEDQKLAKRYRDDDENMFASRKSIAEFQETLLDRDGTEHLCLTAKYLIYDKNENPIGIFGHYHDIAEQEKKKRLADIWDKMPGGLVVYKWDENQLKTIYISEFYEKQYGNSLVNHGQNEDGTDFMRIHPDDLPAYKKEIKKSLDEKHYLEYVFRVWNRNEERYAWVKMNAVSDLQADGTSYVYAMYSDVTMQIEAEQKLEYENTHDSLTGLYNRSKIFEECRKLLHEHPQEKFAMLHFDIKQFRLYNTFFGEKAGDKLLCDIADMFRRMDADYEYWAYGRVEADVFCVLFPICQNKYQKHLNDLLNGLDQYRDDFQIEPVIGIYTVTDPEMPIESMFSRATIAAKNTQIGTENKVMFFNDEMEQRIIDTQKITREMKNALAEKQFKVYLQPKYSLFTNKMVGTEALVRWIHPKNGMVSPGSFIPIFENNGFISTLDRYMWEEVCILIRKWMDEGRRVLPVSVNVSRISMYSISTVPFLKSLVNKYDIDPKYLGLELTESAYMDDPDDMKNKLKDLQDFGFQIWMDDFGKGYSSFNTLRELPVNILKLDMQFLPKSKKDTRGCALVSAIVEMSHKLNLYVVAEGVETEEQAEFLREFNCQYVQGFLFARPMPVADYEELLKNSEDMAAGEGHEEFSSNENKM